MTEEYKDVGEVIAKAGGIEPPAMRKVRPVLAFLANFVGTGITPRVSVVAVCLGTLYALCGPLNSAAAVGSPAAVDPPVARTPAFSPRAQDPRELEQALYSTDAKQAARLLAGFGCSPLNADSSEVVKRAWDGRDSTAADGATRDPVVRAWMAKCLAEQWSLFRATQPSDASIIAQLRQSIRSNNPEEARAAGFGLTHVATEEDVQAVVAVPARLPALGASMAFVLSEICRVDAVAGIFTIRGRVTDERQRNAIDALVQTLPRVRRQICGFDANIVGSSMSQADVEEFWVPNHGGGVEATAQEIADAFHSSNVVSAREILWHLRCVPSEQTSIDAVRQAWRVRNVGPPDSVARDAMVRVNMAMCLADAHAVSGAPGALDSSIAAELRKALKNGDARYLIAGMEGLSRIASAADIQLIASAVRRQRQFFAQFAVGALSTTCAPGAAEAAANLREWVTNQRIRDQIDYEIKSTEKVRAAICGATAVNRHVR